MSEARLRHLTAQIEPHFLFNSLNAISNRLHEDVDAADRMISQLSDLLRAAYESDDHVLVPLSRELGWLRGYTAMMAERFRGLLVCEIEVAPEVEAVQVPRLLLQPILENALKHGLSDGRGWLRVRAKLLRFIADWADFRVVAEAGTVEEGIVAVRTVMPDVLFLDIQLGNRSGFEVLDTLTGTPTPTVIFTTAYSEYAVKAFELQALDYLLKPFDRDRFNRGMERTREALKDPDHGDVEERVRRLLSQIPGRPATVQQILIKDTDRAFS